MRKPQDLLLSFSPCSSLWACVLLVLSAGCRSSPVKSAAAGAEWYSAEPLLVSLRPDARAGLEGKLGVRTLEELPFYDLDASVDLSGGKFSLREDVWLTNMGAEPWNDVVLRLYANASSARDGTTPPERLISGSCLGSVACTVSADTKTALSVHPASPVIPGARLHVNVVIEGTLEKIDSARTSLLAQSLEGMKSLATGTEGSGNYGLLAMGDGIASFGNFYPVLARRVSGGWEREEKSALGDLGSDEMSHVRARIELPAAAQVSSSGVVTADEPVGAGRHAIRVTAAAVRDFAFVATEEPASKSRDVSGVTVTSHFRPGDHVAGEHALDAGASALLDFERHFGPYPYPKLEIAEAAIVGGAGGVEFSGLVTIASMFYRPMEGGGAKAGSDEGLLGGLGLGGDALTGMTDSMLEFVVAHEVAHQYWHGLVGSDSRDHPFVDEALAQYSAIVYLEDRYGKERAEKDGLLNVKANYQMMRMLGTADAPVDRPVETFGSMIAYAGIVYGKAPYFYAALRKTLGDQAFFSGLHAYVAKYAFRVAPSSALTDVLGPQDPKLLALAQHWLQETHGDEDIGQADLAKLMGAMLGPDAMKQLGPLLQGNGKGTGGIDLGSVMKQLGLGQQ
jgi:Peptidase family M1 domain